MTQTLPVEKVHKIIDERFDDHVRKIQEYLKQPSVSVTGEGILESAELTRDYIRDLGGQATLAKTKGHPIVWGRLKSEMSDRTLLKYDMADVQPPDPVEEWTSPPFAAEIVNDRIVARGAHNNKGPLRAYFNTLEAILEAWGDIPFNILFLIESEEEIGSHSLPAFVEDHKSELLSAEGIDGWFPYQPTPTSPPPIELGFKGCVYLELECRASENDIHSMFASAVHNPAWRLLWALNSMRDSSDRVSIKGFYDDVRSPTAQERESLSRLMPYIDWLKEQSGVTRFRGGSMEGVLEELFYRPSPMNIEGLVSGWTGVGSKTIVPATAKAKIDVRIVPNQNPEKVARLIRQHLDEHGFADVLVSELDLMTWSRTSPDTHIVRAALKTCKDFGWEPMIVPTDPGTGPEYLFNNNPPLRLPSFYGGLGHGGKIHAPNEYFTLDGIRIYEKSEVNFLNNVLATEPSM